jgi:molecular chaperone DnaK
LAVCVGIDLGTTFSALAVLDESGSPKIVHNKDGQNVTPSCVSEQEGKFEVGEYARQTWGQFPEMAAARFKRNMGTTQKHKISGRDFTPTELSALVLKKLVQDAEVQIGRIDEAVITIPANFSHEAREATMAAAKAAGVPVKYIINEPTAAALYYAFKSGIELDGVYAIYDLGGGTFDVSIIKAKGHEVEVLASNGISKLGGDDFDSALISLLKKKFSAISKVEFPNDDFSKNSAEELKKALSTRQKSKVKVGEVAIEISRQEFEESISSLIAQTEMLCESTMEEAKVSASNFNGVFLVGGSSRTPAVQESVKRIFGRVPESTFNVDEVVALGAALYAAYKGDRNLLTPKQNRVIENIRVTETSNKCFGTISVSHNPALDVEKVKNSVLITKGTKLPCEITETFFTRADGQEYVKCQVTESNAPETDPRFVKVVWQGRLELPPGRPAGQAIKITYAYDLNQIMSCSFVDESTGVKTTVDLSIGKSDDLDVDKINKFMVD